MIFELPNKTFSLCAKELVSKTLCRKDSYKKQKLKEIHIKPTIISFREGKRWYWSTWKAVRIYDFFITQYYSQNYREEIKECHPTIWSSK